MKTKPTMRLLLKLLLFITFSAASRFACAESPDSLSGLHEQKQLSFLIVPYKPMMHLSDADNDLARYSEMNPQEVRNQLRMGLLKNLNTKLVMEYEVKIPDQDFVESDDRDLELIYNSLAFGEDTVYPLKNHSKRDSMQWKKKIFSAEAKSKNNPDKTYINVDFYDQHLLPDLASKYNSDYFIFLNELDIKTNFADCLDLALKIYQRELKVHYSVFDRNGKQVFGDVAVVNFPSNSNDVDEIIASNFPGISDHIISSVKEVSKSKPIVVQ